MADFTSTPVIIWQTLGMSSTDRQLSPAITFMGVKWRLKLARTQELLYGDRFRLTLERLSLPPKSSLDAIIFDVQTEVEAKGKRGLALNTTSSLDYNEWYLWDQNMSDICKKFDITFWEDIIIWVVIKPRSGVSVFPRRDVKDDFSEGVLHLSKDLSKLCDNKDQSDVVLKCGDKSISAHKAILCTRSEYFAGMFRNKTKEAEENVVEVKNTEPAVLEELVCYLYTGEISDFRTDSLRKLYAIADMYAVEALKLRCAFLVMDSYRLDAGANRSISVASLPESTPVDNQLEEDKVEGGSVESSENGDDDVEDSQLEETSAKNNQLLKDLFRSREWETLSLENPKLAHDMCKSLLFNRDL